MSGYHPDAVQIVAHAMSRGRPWSEGYLDDAREILDQLEECGFMVVDARGAESITLETPPQGDTPW